MKRVLSTKILSPSQRELLLNSGIALVEYDAIEIEFQDFQAPSAIQNAIVTSQNAALSIISKNLSIEHCFCVGDKTKVILEENGLNVRKTAQKASELAQFIAKSYKNEGFLYFCGNKRRDEIPAILQETKIPFQEIQTYKTTLVEKKFDQEWDGILFFSPSGVASFTASNTLGNATAFSIGPTTAKALEEHTANIVISNTTSVESVIAKTVKTLLQHA